ncbi:MAG: hypothetical protein QOE80_1325 [Actinomycetota bacterium]|nr:hypothetical protein [Actinomycetota bacterium]
MNVKPGTYNLGPSDGSVRVKTGRQGMASKVGHDLTLEAGNWKATVVVDGDPSRSEVQATIEPRSLEVTAATGGAKPVSAGQTRPVTLDLTGSPDGRLKGSIAVVQSQFGIKPFSAMMGALKVKDEVEVSFDVALPAESA